MPAQVTWRASEELIARLKAAAADRGVSMNEYLTELVEAATDPANAPTSRERLRAKLRAAGLLAPPYPPSDRPPVTDEELEEIRRSVDPDFSWSDHVIEERRR